MAKFVFFLFLCLGLVAPAMGLEVKVVDKNGVPLKDTVVVLGGAGGSLSAQTEPAIMDQIGKKFVPHVLIIEQGQDVVFPNSDQVRHHVYSFSEPKRFEIKLYEGVPPEPITFDKPGLVVLGCNIHDSMLGYIFVTDKPNSGLTDSSGKVSFDTPVQAQITLSLWHPWMGPVSSPQSHQISSADGTSLEFSLDVKAPKPKKRFGSRFGRDEYDDDKQRSLR